MAVCRLCMREVSSYLDWSELLSMSGGSSDKDNCWREELAEVRPLSYKGCYYKYTQFMEDVTDHPSQFICDICASCIRNFHLLVDKSVEAKYVLEQQLDTGIKVYNVDDKVFQRESQHDEQNYEVRESVDTDPLHIFVEVPVEAYEIASPLGKYVLIETDYSDDFKTVNLKKEHVGLCATTKSKVTKARRLSKLKRTMYSDRSRDFLNTLDTPYITDVSECNDIEVVDGNITPEDENEQNKSEKKSPKDKELEDLQTNKTEERPKGNIIESNLSSDTSEKKMKEVKTRKPGCKSQLFLCCQCSLTFKNMNDLSRHETIHDKNRERKEVCPKCGLKLFNKLTLKQHMVIHDVNREKRFKCDFCEKAFYNRGACNIHMRIHLGTMLQCPLCPKQLYRQIDLDRHMVSHSQTPLNRVKPKVKYYLVKCKECGKDVRSDYFKEHQAMHMNKPIMQCTLCKKDFFGRAKCRQHMKRFHKKTSREFEDAVYYYEKDLHRYSHLMIKQMQESEHKIQTR